MLTHLSINFLSPALQLKCARRPSTAVLCTSRFVRPVSVSRQEVFKQVLQFYNFILLYHRP